VALSKAGKNIYRNNKRYHAVSTSIFSGMEKDLRKIVDTATRESASVYAEIFRKLTVSEGGIIELTTENLAQASPLMARIEVIQNEFRQRYGSVVTAARTNIIQVAKNREFEIEKILKKEGIDVDRSTLTEEIYNILETIHQQGFKRMNDVILRWKDFVYDTFFAGVTKGLTIDDFRNTFFNTTGTLKIGSSLEQISISEAMIAVTEERTAFNRQKAKEEKMTYCWNFNPLDFKTKPECLSATLAGVISEKEMGSSYGFPPRYVCRCEITFTRPEWVELNQGINEGIEERRQQYLNDLENAPRQKPFWTQAGTKVVPLDPERASGTKMYKDIQEKHNLASYPVADFEPPPGLVAGDILT
jgi:hypothetical protein